MVLLLPHATPTAATAAMDFYLMPNVTIWGSRILEGHLVTFHLKCDELWAFRVDSDDLGGQNSRV